MDDRQIIEQVKNGDTQAYETLVLRYQQKVYNLALRMTGNPDDALDLSQEAFVRAWRALESFQFDAAFSTWIYRLTSNLCIDFLRAQKRRKTVSLTFGEDDEEPVQLDIPDPQPTPEEQTFTTIEHELLVKALNALEVEQRQIITLRVIDDLSYADIAQLLGVKEGTVKSRLSRAREKLKIKVLQMGNNSFCVSSTKVGRGDAQ